MWQDLVLTIGSVVMTIFMIPQIYDVFVKKNSLNLVTACSFTCITAVYCFTYYTLGLMFSAVPFNTAAWFMIMVGSWRNLHGQEKIVI